MRQYNNLSQQDLADKSGVKQPMIARFERGINTPNMSTVLKLLAAFGKTLYNGALLYGCIVCEKKNSTDTLNVGAVLRHDVPIKRARPLALQSSYLVRELRYRGCFTKNIQIIVFQCGCNRF